MTSCHCPLETHLQSLSQTNRGRSNGRMYQGLAGLLRSGVKVSCSTSNCLRLAYACLNALLTYTQVQGWGYSLYPQVLLRPWSDFAKEVSQKQCVEQDLRLQGFSNADTRQVLLGDGKVANSRVLHGSWVHINSASGVAVEETAKVNNSIK